MSTNTPTYCEHHNNTKVSMSTSTLKKQNEHFRFQFMFGSFDEDHMTARESLTVTYVVPYTPDFCLSDLRKHVEAEHDENIRTAHRTGNDLRRNERLGIAKASIESVREWFSCVDTTEFT